MIDDQFFKSGIRDHYDELDHYYREIWGEHVHHGLWERGDETAHEAVLSTPNKTVA